MSGPAAKYTETYPRGHVLFEEGEPGQRMYVLRSGRVQLTRKVRGEDKILCIVPPGECFGEMALLLERPRTATATILDDALLLAIDQATFEDMIKNNAPIAVRLMKLLAARLERANQQVETLLLANLGHRVVHALMHMAEDMGQKGVGGVLIPLTPVALADRVGTSLAELEAEIGRLSEARLVTVAPGRGYYVGEIGKLHEFLEFLELKERFGE